MYGHYPFLFLYLVLKLGHCLFSNWVCSLVCRSYSYLFDFDYELFGVGEFFLAHGRCGLCQLSSVVHACILALEFRLHMDVPSTVVYQGAHIMPFWLGLCFVRAVIVQPKSPLGLGSI